MIGWLAAFDEARYRKQCKRQARELGMTEAELDAAVEARRPSSPPPSPQRGRPRRSRRAW